MRGLGKEDDYRISNESLDEYFARPPNFGEFELEIRLAV